MICKKFQSIYLISYYSFKLFSLCLHLPPSPVSSSYHLYPHIPSLLIILLTSYHNQIYSHTHTHIRTSTPSPTILSIVYNSTFATTPTNLSLLSFSFLLIWIVFFWFSFYTGNTTHLSPTPSCSIISAVVVPAHTISYNITLPSLCTPSISFHTSHLCHISSPKPTTQPLPHCC